MSLLSSAHMLFGGASTLLSGLVGFWKMNGDATDVLGVSNGTVNGSSWGTGKISQGSTLDGTAWVDVGTNAAIHPSLITVAGWFYFTSAPAEGARIMNDWHQDGGHDRWIFYVTGGTLLWYVRSLTTTGSPTLGAFGSSIPNATWVHLAGTYDGATARAYRDGALVASTPLAGTGLHLGSLAVRFGRQGAEIGAGMAGTLDEVGMWDRALSDGEVSELYNSGAGKSHPFS